MKKKFFLLLNFLFPVTEVIFAQANSTVIPSTTESENNVVDPDKFFYFIVLGLCVVFVLFIIFALSRATSVLSKSLGKRYQTITPTNDNSL